MNFKVGVIASVNTIPKCFTTVMNWSMCPYSDSILMSMISCDLPAELFRSFMKPFNWSPSRTSNVAARLPRTPKRLSNIFCPAMVPVPTLFIAAWSFSNTTGNESILPCLSMKSSVDNPSCCNAFTCLPVA